MERATAVDKGLYGPFDEAALAKAAVFGHNGSMPEKITRWSVDIIAVLIKFMIPTLTNHSISVMMSDGTTLHGFVDPEWRLACPRLVGKCFYRQ